VSFGEACVVKTAGACALTCSNVIDI